MKENFYSKVWFKYVVWILLYILLFNMFYVYNSLKFSILESGFTILSLILIHTISLKYLIPYVRKYHNWKIFFLVLLFCMFLTVLITQLETMFLKLFFTISSKHPPYIGHLLKNFFQLSFVFLIDVIMSLMKSSQKFLEREKQLQGEKLVTELKLLKAQINPHFIFNALNNIYSLSYMKSENAPESILKLSEMLRYVFYDCSKDRVRLESEFKYIKNFTLFQQMKSEAKQNVVLNKMIVRASHEVAPMLFIPFVENAFKYSRIEDLSEASVAITLKDDEDNNIIFDILNTVPLRGKVQSGNGMGLKNVKNRLNIIYPNSYDLKIEELKDKYHVHLIIKDK